MTTSDKFGLCVILLAIAVLLSLRSWGRQSGHSHGGWHEDLLPRPHVVRGWQGSVSCVCGQR
jgi:hypothetical protein